MFCTLIISFLLFTILSGSQDVQSKVKCDTRNHSFCVYLATNTKSYWDAEKSCREFGMTLVTVRSRQDQLFLNELTKNNSNFLWIGLYFKKGQLRWTSTYPAVANLYTNNHLGSSDGCLATIPGQTNWTTAPCNSTLPYICGSIPTQVLPDPITNNVSYTCPIGYKLFDHFCFMLNTSSTLNWKDALSACEKSTPGASLASIDSFHYQDALSTMISRSPHPAWIGMIANQLDHTWVNKHPIQYTNWMPRSLINPFYASKCVMMHQRSKHLGLWEHMDCDTKLNYFCQVVPKPIKESSDESIKILHQGGCQSGWYEYSNRCYRLKFDHEKAATNEKPLAPYSLDELAFMRLLLHRSPNRSNDKAKVGITLHFTSSSPKAIQIYGENGEPFYMMSVLNLVTEGTNSSGPLALLNSSVPHCFIFNRNNTDLDMLPCFMNMTSVYGYELSGYHRSPWTGDLGSVSSCPSSWHRLANKCFFAVQDIPQTWSDAKAYCNRLNSSHLASIHNPSEQDFVGSILGDQSGWLGLRATRRSSYDSTAHQSYEFDWSDGSPVNYLSFGPNESSKHYVNESVEACFIHNKGTHDWKNVNCHDRHLFVCQLVLNLNASRDTQQQVSKTNSMKFCSKELSDYCILVVPQTKSFSDADNYCRNHSMTLATVPSQAHHEFIMSQINTAITKAYIGLFTSHGILLWTSTYPAIPATFWNPLYKSVPKQCTYINTEFLPNENWASDSCDKSRSFICSSTVVFPRATHSVSKGYACPAQFNAFEGNCFIVKTDEVQLSWSEASAACSQQDSNAHLASVNSLSQQDFLNMMLDKQSSSVWIGLKSDGNMHTWSTNETVQYTNWKPGEPNSVGPYCVVAHHEHDQLGQWSDEKCNERFGYVCQTNPTPIQKGIQLKPEVGLLKKGQCMDAYFAYRGVCYTLPSVVDHYHRNSTSFTDVYTTRCRSATDETNATCNSDSGMLRGTRSCPIPAIPHNSMEASFMRTLIRTYNHASDQAWIGLKSFVSNNSFKFISDDAHMLGVSELIDFASLVLNATDLKSNNSRYYCLAASTKEQNLKFQPCSTHNLPILCSYYLDATVKTEKPVYPSLCPNKWVSFGDKCYWSAPAKERRNWFEAQQMCEQQGQKILSNYTTSLRSHLVSIHSEEDTRFLANLSLSSSIWIGLKITYSQKENSSKPALNLAWNDGSVLDYLNVNLFASSTSSVFNGLNTCVEFLSKTLSWSPNRCDQPSGIVCGFHKAALTTPKSIPTAAQPDESLCEKNMFQLKTTSKSACYSIFHSRQNWLAAERNCRSLNEQAHLISVHSQSEMNELSELIREHIPSNETVWIGLSQTDFAYSWSDQSLVDFIPFSADQSKESRQHLQDCFCIYTGYSAPNYSFPWRAMDCELPASAFICKSPLKVDTQSFQPHKQSVVERPPVQCPFGFHGYNDRCFKVILDKLTWFEANELCEHITKPYPNFMGSLARVDNSLEQQFVASMLSQLSPYESAAWIGLVRNVSEGLSRNEWSDKVKPRMIRPIVRDPAIIGFKTTWPTRLNYLSNLSLCTAMFRSTNPRLNGVWLQWPCDEAIYLSSICQAWPTEPKPNTNLQRPPVSPIHSPCPPEFQLSTTGLGLNDNTLNRLSQPVCYRVYSHTTALNWDDANRVCRNMSTPEFSVSLISLASVFEANYLRAWLRQSRSSHGGGLRETEVVWTSLKQSQANSDRDWTWSTMEHDPVRYTDSIEPLSIFSNSCYFFDPSPYARGFHSMNSGLGSLQLASSCDVQYVTVCQTTALILSNKSKLHELKWNHQPSRPTCAKNESDNTKFYLTNVTHTISGRPCIRWDLVALQPSEFSLTLNRSRNYLSAATLVGGDSTMSYAEHFCSYFHDRQGTRFGCYVQAKPVVFEDCQPQLCTDPTYAPRILPRVRWMEGAFLFVVISSFIFFAGIFVWWGVTRKCKRRYAYSLFGHHQTSVKKGSSVYFNNSMDNTSSTTGTVDVRDANRIRGDRDLLLPLQIGGPRKDRNLDKIGQNSITPPPLSMISPYGLVTFNNPIYTPSSDGFLDDTYDPEPAM